MVMVFCFFALFANDALAAKTDKAKSGTTEKSALKSKSSGTAEKNVAKSKKSGTTEKSVVKSKKSDVAEKSAVKSKRSGKTDKSGAYPGTASISGKSERKAKKSTKITSSDRKKKSSKSKTSTHASRNSKKRVDSRQAWLDGTVEQAGKASWYGGSFHGGPTASGVTYDMHAFTAAHRTLPLGTVVKVTVENTRRSVMVCINDRGPFVKGRVIDLSYAAARQLGFGDKGILPVQIEVVSDQQGRPLNNDSAFYVTRFESSSDKKGETLGPFVHFADATVMHEVLSGEQPNKAVIELGPLVSEK